MTTDNIEKARDILELGMAEFNVDKMKWAKGISSNNSFQSNVEYLMALLETVMQLLSSGDEAKGEARGE